MACREVSCWGSGDDPVGDHDGCWVTQNGDVVDEGHLVCSVQMLLQEHLMNPNWISAGIVVKECQNALKSTSHFKVWQTLGMALYLDRKLQDAKEALLRSLELCPDSCDDSDIRMNLGDIEKLMEKDENDWLNGTNAHVGQGSNNTKLKVQHKKKKRKKKTFDKRRTDSTSDSSEYHSLNSSRCSSVATDASFHSAHENSPGRSDCSPRVQTSVMQSSSILKVQPTTRTVKKAPGQASPVSLTSGGVGKAMNAVCKKQQSESNQKNTVKANRQLNAKVSATSTSNQSVDEGISRKQMGGHSHIISSSDKSTKRHLMDEKVLYERSPGGHTVSGQLQTRVVSDGAGKAASADCKKELEKRTGSTIAKTNADSSDHDSSSDEAWQAVGQKGTKGHGKLNTNNSSVVGSGAIPKVKLTPATNSNGNSKRFTFQLGCNECFSSKGKKSSLNEHLEHACHRDLLVAQRTSAGSWVYVHPLPAEISGLEAPISLCRNTSCSGDCNLAHSPLEKEIWEAHRRKELDINKVWQELMKEFPLKNTHEFKLACRQCFTTKQSGESWCGSFSTSAHSTSACDKSILIVAKTGQPWMMIREHIVKPQYKPQLCYNKDKPGHFATFGEKCFYAHSDEELILWTMQQQGSFNFEQFFVNYGAKRGGEGDNVGQLRHSARQVTERLPNLGSSQNTSGETAKVSRKFDANFPYKLYETCWLCWTSQTKNGHNDHQMCFIEPKSGKRIRRPVFGNYSYKLCDHQKNHSCFKGLKCTYAHNEEEKIIWTYLRQSGLKIEDLVIPMPPQKQSSVPQRTVQRTVQRERQVFLSTNHCHLCNCTCNSKKQLKLHQLSARHRNKALAENEDECRFREPPYGVSLENLQICRDHIQDDSCQFSCVSDDDNLCLKAHCYEELTEWRQRLEQRKRKRTKSSNDELAYMDKLLLDKKQGSKQLVEHVNGVEIQSKMDDKIYLKKKSEVYRWEFTIQCKMDLKLLKACLLYPGDSQHFALHTSQHNNNEFQIEDGKSFEVSEDRYTVFVSFRAETFGTFHQSLCFDFGLETVVEKKLEVHVGERESLDWLEEMRSSLFRPDIWTESNRTVVKFDHTSVTEKETEMLQKYPLPSSGSVVDCRLKGNRLTCGNYKDRMHQLINVEEGERWKLLKERFSMKCQLIPKKTIMTDGEKPSFLIGQEGQLFARVELQVELSEDMSAGVLLLQSVQHVLIAPVNSDLLSNVYQAVIKSCVREAVVIHLSSACCKDLQLKEDTPIDIEIQFQMNRIPFCEMHHAVDMLDVKLVFPDMSLDVVPSDSKMKRVDQLIHSYTRLNESQAAVTKYVMCCANKTRKPVVVYGPYGTGKTETLAKTALLLACHNPSQRILICTHTNSAADIFIKCHIDEWNKKFTNKAVKTLRVHNANVGVSRIPEEVRQYSLISSTDEVMLPSMADVLKHQIVVATLTSSLGLAQMDLRGHFTHIFIDEAAQDLECRIVMPLTLASDSTCVLLAGDHKQMAPKVYSSLAKENRFDVTLLTRLTELYVKVKSEQSPVHMLKENYRSHPRILRFLSSVFYGGEDVIKVRGTEECKSWKPISFYCVAGEESQEETTNYFNLSEAEEVTVIVQNLCQNWPREWGPLVQSQIAVVSCYTKQVNVIRHLLRRKKLSGVTVESIYNVQGKEFKAMIISTVRTRNTTVETDKDYGFLSDEKMLNTAFTRAKSMVAVVGDPVALCLIGHCNKIWQNYLNHCEQEKSLVPLTLKSIKESVDQYRLQNRLTAGNVIEESDVKPLLQKGCKRQSSWDPSYVIEPDLIIQQLAQWDQSQRSVPAVSAVSQQPTNVQFDSWGFAFVSEESNCSVNESNLIESSVPGGPICKLEIRAPDESYAKVMDSNRQYKILSRKSCGQAFDGDEVQVEVHENGVTCHVTKVIRRVQELKSRSFVCRVNSENPGVALPINKRAPCINLLKQKKGSKGAISVFSLNERGCIEEHTETVFIDKIDSTKDLLVVQILKWEPGYLFPLGIVVERLQSGCSYDQDLEILNKEHQLSEMFSQDSRHELAIYEGFAIDQSILDSREDYRDLYTFTVDPEGSQDLDDALSVEKDGEYFKVGVHIADVSHFVSQNSALDKEALSRGTSYYPENRSPIPMIPHDLSSNLCSLLPDQERLTLSMFFQIDKEGHIWEVFHPALAVIRSNCKLSYKDAENVIENVVPVHVDLDAVVRIQILHGLAMKRAIRRRGDEFYQSQTDDFPKSHSMIEEFMIAANREVAKILVDQFPNSTPLRCQDSIDDELHKSWLNNNQSHAGNSFLLSSIVENLSSEGVDQLPDKPMYILKEKWCEAMLELTKDNLEKARSILLNIDYQPDISVAQKQWHRLQERAVYRCSSESTEQGHQSLGFDVYTHFTSPIRRYIDIVVHRMLKSIMINSMPPQMPRKYISQICQHCTYVSAKSNQYERLCRAIWLAHCLKRTPLVAFPVIESLSAGALKLHFLSEQLDTCKNEVKLNDMNPCRRPEMNEEKVLKVDWKMRVYDFRAPFGSDENERKLWLQSQQLPLHNVLKVDNDPYVVAIPGHLWKMMLRSLKNNDAATLKRDIGRITSQVSSHTREDITSETTGAECQSRHFCSFSEEFYSGKVLKVQLMAEMKRGLLTPGVQLVNLTPTIDVCVEHKSNPVECFSVLSKSKASLPNYDEGRYPCAWKEVLDMQAVHSAMDNGESVVIHNVPLLWEDKDSGRFVLNAEFCASRSIHFVPTRVKEASGVPSNKDLPLVQKHAVAGDYLCFHYTGTRMCETLPSIGILNENIQNVCWVGHAVTTDVLFDEQKNEFVISYRLHSSSVPLPTELLQSHNTLGCTVEWTEKLLPDRRMLKAMMMFENNNVSQLANAIAYGRRPEKLKGNIFVGAHVDPSVPGLPQPNGGQRDAVVQALQSAFSLIQGPPGTGKTVTGVRIACLFAGYNNQNGGHVLYSGPSNKSVDVVTSFMKTKLGKTFPSIVRVYGVLIEDHDYPLPTVSSTSNSKSHSKIVEEAKTARLHKDVALHHIIRRKDQLHAKELRDFDALFGNHREMATKSLEELDKLVKQYKKVVYEAKKDCLSRVDIILCTCTCSAAPALTSLNIKQLIIDECGQCTEPDSMIPITKHKKLKQVILIGDHQQLRPVVTCEAASQLGLSVSLFERYAERKATIKQLNMLTTQYRMHNAIQEFPSNEFYNGKLTVGKELQKNMSNLDIWPGGRYRPLVFCHTEGEEETLFVSTDEGGLNSKSNAEEVKHAVRIARYLSAVEKNKSIVILTQYRAQQHKLSEALKLNKLSDRVDVTTVISSQGGEWDYVILSTVRSLPEDQLLPWPTAGWKKKNMGFITDCHQVNVAITRAKLGLVIIGNRHLLELDKVWERLIAHFRRKNSCVDVGQFLEKWQ